MNNSNYIYEMLTWRKRYSGANNKQKTINLLIDKSNRWTQHINAIFPAYGSCQ